MLLPRLSAVFAVLLLASLPALQAHADPVWGTFGGNARHTALSSHAAQPLQAVHWQTPVDLHPQYSFTGSLNTHYGSPLVTQGGRILIPVKTGVMDSFRVESRDASNGTLRWQKDSDYRLPAHNWIPGYGPALTPAGRLYLPAAGGTVLYTDGAEAASLPAFTRVAFYGLANYNSNPTAYDSDIRICTPITPDAQGNVFFAYRAAGTNPLSLRGALVRLGANGIHTYVTAQAATGDAGANPLTNCAPALSNGGDTLYMAFSNGAAQLGYLVALDAATLAPLAVRVLVDPASGLNTRMYTDATSSPMVAPDGRVFFGVMENPLYANNTRGWLLQFTAGLVPVGFVGSFGWDITPSLIPRDLVPSYSGTSPYLVFTKYNNYAGVGTGDGLNRMAVLDPRNFQLNPTTGTPVMKEVLTVLGPTLDPEEAGSHPGAVKEWCINTTAVDPFTHRVLAGSEDGTVYRWSLDTGALTQSVNVTSGEGESYTPTIIGADGKTYAVHNAILFALGATATAVEAGIQVTAVRLAAPSPTPFASSTQLRFFLAQPGQAILDIVDGSGRRVARLAEGEFAAGEHRLRWNGRGQAGGEGASGVYFARLAAGGSIVTRKLVLAR